MHPAAPQASRPIITPHTSLPSLTTHSATASLTSIVTPVSLAHASHPCSARSSLYISSKPASEHGDIEKDDHPSAETHRPTLVSKFAAHIKSWAAGERNALVNHPPYSSAHVFNPRSRTVIRAQPVPQRSPTAATVKDAESAVEHCLAEATAAMETVRFGRQSKVTSPASLFPVHSDVLALRNEHASSPVASPGATKAKPRARRMGASGWVESTEQMRRAREENQQAEERAKHLSPAERETLTREEHPAFRTRGRRAERAVC
ncbi:hypothetical protein PHLCEN_2v10368 [Hermanssonia centrifuga]|uniref:Uncharacterized protein n=1 Tax=Hermanssonia centrifuga TaxID=98765 RepID=A0A2R6NN26_9APHY|nr:hypothetical protein PHLCEN_2v10368 [Hermanssonia centrifuga]